MAERRRQLVGINWMLVGNEVVGFQECEVSGQFWILRGLIRGMRGTQRQLEHTAGEQCLYLTPIIFQQAGRPD